jgi:hypothetical protein
LFFAVLHIYSTKLVLGRHVRGKGTKVQTLDEPHIQTPAERCASMTWAQRLKRVFNIDIETCPTCGGAVRIIACI